ncbi:MAG: hypothetical protein NC923_04320, partial [Candidatus Omnitrophica bacterium]|nr:hypothetical protein [Candidatus Omnitrophota bacterium]
MKRFILIVGLAGLFLNLFSKGYAADIEAKLDDNAGASELVVQDSDGTQVAGISSDGDITLTDTAATVDPWIGLGASSGKIEFDDQTTDEINFLNCRVGIGTDTPNALIQVSGLINFNNGTFLGLNAGAANTGSHNTAVGGSALHSNTTGGYNTAIGDSALYSNTTGGDNTAIGDSALYSNTTGSRNIAIGASSILNSTSCSDTVAIGYNTLWNMSTVDSVVAIGNYAGRGFGYGSNVGGVYIGYQTGMFLRDGANYNILIGYKSGYDITTGQNNIILGPWTVTSAGITTGSNNILIGKEVRYGLSQTGSNQLNIG